MIDFRAQTIKKLRIEQFATTVTEKLATTLHFFENSPEQIAAWGTTAEWIHQALTHSTSGTDDLRVIFEFAPPLTIERPDVLVIGEHFVLVIEAKTGSQESPSQAKRQVLGYAKTLYNYINVGQEKTIIPIVLRTGASHTFALTHHKREPILEHVMDISPNSLTELLESISPCIEFDDSSPDHWLFSPRPTIIEAARLMFNETTEINVLARMAEDDELEKLIATCTELIARAKTEKRHLILAVSGVPGSGKTLVGLRLANSQSIQNLCAGDDSSSPLYLSGNGPLVDVLTEAISRDEQKRTGCNVQDARDVAKAKVRLIHGLTTDKFAVKTHVLVFDEAQRAWSEEWMRRKTQNHSLGSEANEVLARMETLDWSVVVCLVGTGQQINNGEKGMATWTKAVSERAEAGHNWTLYGSADNALLDYADTTDIVNTPELHLQIVRRAENASLLGDWVGLLIEGNITGAARVRECFPEFPIRITRSLEDARIWLRDPSRPHYETYGLLASSKSARLSVYGVDAQSAAGLNHDWTQWFLDRPPNLNSSMNLEVAASEFKCQGLELDRTCVCWSWDLVFHKDGWNTRKISKRQGNWSKNKAQREYALNAYRVLLTRARVGMIIWVPNGSKEDSSRKVEEMDLVYDTLVQAGCSPL
jgi:hypothetical protein